MPIMNIAVAVLVILITGLWATGGKGRGLFSSFLNTVCVVVAGAIAFAVWEPLVYGFLLDRVPDMAWGLGLIVPFVVALFVLKIATEKLVPFNMYVGEMTNFVGGLLFALPAAILSVGIFVIGVNFFRVGPELLGYRPIKDEAGNLVYDPRSLWVPVDRITAAFYEHLSKGAFATASPLWLYQPRVHEQAGMMRVVYKDEEDNRTVLARNSIGPDDFEVIGRYRVTPSGRKADELRTDAERPTVAQTVKYTNGEPPPNDAVIEGFIVQFKPGAKEKSGQVVVGASQVRLVCERDRTAVPVHPFAIVAQPEAQSGSMHRFRLDGPDIFVASVGGTATPIFAFEFLVPPDAAPRELLVRNVRVPMEGELADPAKTKVYAGVAKRDEAIKSLALFRDVGASVGGIDEKSLDASGMVTITATGNRYEGLTLSDNLPGRWLINKSDRGGIEIDSENRIIGGQHTWEPKQLDNRSLGKLGVSKFGATRDTVVVQVQLAEKGAQTALGRACEAADQHQPPRLIDDQGRPYDPVGFIYDDGKEITIRFRPDQPLKGLDELPSPLSRTKRDQTVILIYRVAKGSKITSFVIGNKKLAAFSPPVPTGR